MFPLEAHGRGSAHEISFVHASTDQVANHSMATELLPLRLSAEKLVV